MYIEAFRRQFIPRTDKKMVDVLRMNLLFVEFIISLLPARTTHTVSELNGRLELEIILWCLTPSSTICQ